VGRSETTVVDAEGRVLRVRDKTGVDTVMAYDAQGNRQSVTAASGTPVESTVTYTYDRYGRLLSQNDPNHGVYTYTYDALGNKLSEQSPKMLAAGQVRTFTYDKLGRMISRSEPEGTTTWTYDHSGAGDLGIGKLRSESQGPDLREYTYASGTGGAHGRLTDIRTVIGGFTYLEEKAYDANGRLASETYPADTHVPTGFTVDYAYNGAGYLERVTSDGGMRAHYQLVDTNAQGRPIVEWLGDGSTTTQTYDGVSGRLTSQWAQNASTIQQFSYSYDPAGNMSSRNDDLHALGETFSYDNMDRLLSAQVTGQPAVQYAYDDAGSITQKSDIANSFDYLGMQPHAVTLLTMGTASASLTYDANGNLDGGTGSPSITWSSY
jgi:YD repeat-containing protein